LRFAHQSLLLLVYHISLLLSSKFGASPLYPDKAEIEFDGAVHLGTQPGIGAQPRQEALEFYQIKERYI
jgi:hypothetical protein